MNNSTFGLVFKELRKKRGFKLDSFEEIGLTRSTLSRFERGVNSLGVDQFYEALRFMDIPIAEVEQTYLASGRGSFKAIYDELYEAYYTMDVEKIKSFQKSFHEPLQKIAMKCLLLDFTAHGKLTEEEEEGLVDFFDAVEDWTVYEFSLLQFSIAQLHARNIANLLSQLHEDTAHFRHIRQYRRYIIQITLKGAFALMVQDKLKRAEKELDTALDFTDQDDLYLRNELFFMQGYLTYKKGFPQKGHQEVKQAIQTFENLGSTNAANYFKMLEKRFMKIKK
ncbi:MAG: helix-turn-helix domain-containing protein [Streptococcaceae bacterium]|jgi:Rgg/GadR/MutR family transcriptional activator|nr:helix-turn-helix domain-containing protein [Streptococcaceae bacterium]